MNDLHFLTRPDGGRLALFRQAPADGCNQAVLVIHGATFPTSLSAAYRIDGRSWFDELCEAGFEVWGLDFQGFGASDQFPVSDAGAIPGRADDAAEQIAMAVDFIRGNSACGSLALVAHSWGTVPAGIFLSRGSEGIDRAVFYGPVVPCESQQALPDTFARHIDVTAEAQWAAFGAGVPEGAEPPVGRAEFQRWVETYLWAGPASPGSTPAVRVPAGPAFDIECARRGAKAYEPREIEVPVLVIRGSWDAVTTELDAARLFQALPASGKRLVTIQEGTHRMHLEAARMEFFRAVEAFITSGARLPSPATQAGALRIPRNTRQRGPRGSAS